MLQRRRGLYRWRSEKAGRLFSARLARIGLAGVLGTIVSLTLSVSLVLADALVGLPDQCRIQSTGALSPHNPTYAPYWYAQVYTGTSTSYTYTLLGAKANLTHAGNPHVFDGTSQHVDVYLASKEQASTTTPPN